MGSGYKGVGETAVHCKTAFLSVVSAQMFEQLLSARLWVRHWDEQERTPLSWNLHSKGEEQMIHK